MPTSTITARTLITASGIVDYPVIHTDADGYIAAISTDPASLANETTALSTGLFDIHNHGAIGIDVMNATDRDLHRLQRFLAEHGVTQYLPTTVTASIDFTLRALETIATVIAHGPQTGEALPLGIHIEGPFLSHSKRGMHPSEHLQPPSLELFDRLQSAAQGNIRLMTIAPERDALPGVVPTASNSALDLIGHATAQGVRCSIGHTDALAAETVAAIEAGAVSATHTFNAMRPLDHREPGVLGTVLDDTRLYSDLICDGVHVSPSLVRLWWRAKGSRRAILITDALSATGMPDGDYVLGNSPVTVHGQRALLAADLAHGKQTLAGSVLTLDRALARFREFTGTSLQDSIGLATHNPASMLGLSELTSVQVGGPATLNRFSAEGKHLETWIHGQRILA